MSEDWTISNLEKALEDAGPVRAAFAYGALCKLYVESILSNYSSEESTKVIGHLTKQRERCVHLAENEIKDLLRDADSRARAIPQLEKLLLDLIGTVNAGTSARSQLALLDSALQAIPLQAQLLAYNDLVGLMDATIPKQNRTRVCRQVYGYARERMSAIWQKTVMQAGDLMSPDYRPKYNQANLRLMYGVLFEMGEHVTFVPDARQIDSTIDLVLSVLTQKQRRAIELYFGLPAGEPLPETRKVAGVFYDGWSQLETASMKVEIPYEGGTHVVNRRKEEPENAGENMPASKVRWQLKAGFRQMRNYYLSRALKSVVA